MGPIVLESFGRLGLRVDPLYCEPDGRFPNHLPDPEVPAYMATLGALVRATGACSGLGFDGDGDRVGVLDEAGRKISADWILVLFARDLLRRHPGGTVRYDVKCSDFVDEDVRAHGGIPVMGETGHSLLKRDIRALDAILGGELSGHIVFNRGFVPIDDSLYSALTFLRLLEESGGEASALFRGFPVLASTAEIKLPCSDATKLDVVSGLEARFQKAGFEVCALDGARVRIPGAWFLVRASNTTPNLTVRLEGRTPEALERAREVLLGELRHYPEADSTPLEARLET
jgi:phosphomannomutase/phosphoglucomutase